jgi:type II secretory pathway pseudopilin PulG
MGGRHRSRRRGVGLLEVIVVIFILLGLAALLLPTTCSSFESGRQNTCRNNLRQLSLALFQYANKTSTNELPGYINALERSDGFAYHDPRTGRVEPVSWVVLILPELDRQALYSNWKSGASPQAGARIGSPPLDKTHFYLEFLICPSDPQPNRAGTPTCYTVNAGIPDFRPPELQRRNPRCRCAACDPAAQGGAVNLLPAGDHRANGVFFDAFTSSKHLDPTTRARPVVSTLAQIVDPKDKTIMLTENVDAFDYARPDDPNGPTADQWNARAEQRLAVTWMPNSKIDAAAIDTATKTPLMTPPAKANGLNVDAGQGDGISYDYARPSSKHPNGLNVAFVGSQVQFMKDSLSYYVYVKLMTTDDLNASTLDAGGVPTPLLEALRTYKLTDADVNP